jgi:predicted DNA-binding transcriptional regulator YafY
MRKADTIPARVWISQLALPRANRESYATLVQEVAGEGGAEFSLFTSSLDWLANWILSFGGEVEALEPAALRENVQAKVSALVARHRMEEPLVFAAAEA